MWRGGAKDRNESCRTSRGLHLWCPFLTLPIGWISHPFWPADDLSKKRRNEFPPVLLIQANSCCRNREKMQFDRVLIQTHTAAIYQLACSSTAGTLPDCAPTWFRQTRRWPIQGKQEWILRIAFLWVCESLPICDSYHIYSWYLVIATTVWEPTLLYCKAAR